MHVLTDMLVNVSVSHFIRRDSVESGSRESFALLGLGQAGVVEQYAPPPSVAIPVGDALAQIMLQYVQTQQATGKRSQGGYIVLRLADACQGSWFVRFS